VTTPLAHSIAQQLSGLAAFIQQEHQPASPEGMFALHVFEAAGESGPVTGWPAPPAPEDLRKGRAPVLAEAGYALTRGSEPRPAATVEAWRGGLERLSSKNAFPADRQTFAYRPLELYGLCLGARGLLDTEAASLGWLKEVARRLEGLVAWSSWGGLLTRLAASVVGVRWSGGWTASDQAIDEIGLLRWVGVAHPSLGPALPEGRVLDADILRCALLAPLPQTDVARAAALFQALRTAAHERLESDLTASWQVSRPTQDAVALILNLCRRFPLFATQIQVRHGKRKTMRFTDEYDVQDAMHALLWLFFHDVRAEEVTPSYAGTSSRIDFLLKREKVVVEVKMTRDTLKQRDVASQLIEDKERYRTHPDFRTLVCFVYDPDGHLTNPTALEDDVSQDAEGFRVVVIVAPKGS
jgi:hypothetical protein